MIRGGFLRMNVKQCKNTRISSFYMLPKVHKNLKNPPLEVRNSQLPNQYPISLSFTLKHLYQSFKTVYVYSINSMELKISSQLGQTPLVSSSYYSLNGCQIILLLSFEIRDRRVVQLFQLVYGTLGGELCVIKPDRLPRQNYIQGHTHTVDDILLLWSGSELELDVFLNKTIDKPLLFFIRPYQFS